MIVPLVGLGNGFVDGGLSPLQIRIFARSDCRDNQTGRNWRAGAISGVYRAAARRCCAAMKCSR
jgi:hypothetical protein